MSRFKLAITVLGITLLSAGVVWFTDTRGASDVVGLSSSTPQGPGLDRYSDPLSGFFFDYPETLSLSETDDNGSHVIFGDTADGETRLLIVISPYFLDEPLTEQMLRDQLDASDTASVTLPSGASALLGRRSDTPLGPTQDAFLVHRGMLYQVSTTADLYDAFNGILATWRFED